MIVHICFVVLLGCVLVQGSPLLVADEDIREWSRAIDALHEALGSMPGNIEIAENTDKKVIAKGILDSMYLGAAAAGAPVSVPVKIVSMGVQEFWNWLFATFQRLVIECKD